MDERSPLVLRGPVQVRDATPEDVPALVDTWVESMGERGAVEVPSRQEVTAAVARTLAEPSERLLVGVSGGKVAGMAHLRRAPLTPIHDEDAVHVNHLHVRRAFRRRGVGEALLSEATLWADEKDSGHIMTMAPATARDGNRFLARLGLAPVAVVRGTTVPQLRLKLAAAQTSSAAAPTVAARRSALRRRAVRQARR